MVELDDVGDVKPANSLGDAGESEAFSIVSHSPFKETSETPQFIQNLPVTVTGFPQFGQQFMALFLGYCWHCLSASIPIVSPRSCVIRYLHKTTKRQFPLLAINYLEQPSA